MSKRKKITIVALLAAALIGASVMLAQGDAVSRALRDHDIFRMVAEDTAATIETNQVMDRIKEKAAILDEKLALTTETNDLLKEQIALVDEFNAQMDIQGPMMDEANAYLDQIQAETDRSLALCFETYPSLDQVDAEMQESVILAQNLVYGLDAAVALTAAMSGELDASYAYTVRIARQNAKMGAFTASNPLDLAFLQSFVPKTAAPQQEETADTAPDPTANDPLGLVQLTQTPGQLLNVLGQTLQGLLGGGRR